MGEAGLDQAFLKREITESIAVKGSSDTVRIFSDQTGLGVTIFMCEPKFYILARCSDCLRRKRGNPCLSGLSSSRRIRTCHKAKVEEQAFQWIRKRSGGFRQVSEKVDRLIQPRPSRSRVVDPRVRRKSGPQAWQGCSFPPPGRLLPPWLCPSRAGITTAL